MTALSFELRIFKLPADEQVGSITFGGRTDIEWRCCSILFEVAWGIPVEFINTLDCPLRFPAPGRLYLLTYRRPPTLRVCCYFTIFWLIELTIFLTWLFRLTKHPPPLAEVQFKGFTRDLFDFCAKFLFNSLTFGIPGVAPNKFIWLKMLFKLPL